MLARAAVAGVAAALALPAAAAGAHDTPRASPTGDAPTTARLQVEGDGMVRLSGRMVAFGLLPDDATVWFRDLGGDARFFIDGREPNLRENRVTQLRRRSGRFYVSGSEVLLQIRAEGVSLSAAGRARAWLSGDGRYRLNGGPAEEWSHDKWLPRPFWVLPERSGRTAGDA